MSCLILFLMLYLKLFELDVWLAHLKAFGLSYCRLFLRNQFFAEERSALGLLWILLVSLVVL